MPVKVRCKGCKKVLTVPDRARGKVVKCPSCQTRIRIPQGEQAKQKKETAAAPASTAAAPESDAFLSGFDLDREDANVRLCPRCGTEVAEEDVECPNCEVDLSTGQLSERALVSRGRKGPNPEMFFQTMRGDAWGFLKGHRKLVIRTIVYTVVSITLSSCCLWMALWSGKLPLKVFWGFSALVSGMVAPGWAWFLHTEIIKITLAKKKKIKRVRFDFFLNSALGIKFFVWLLAFSAPVQVVTGGIGMALLSREMPIAGIISIATGFVIAMLMFPIVMVHMSMPVTGPGWLFPKMGGLFLQISAPVLHWQMFFVLTMLPVLSGLATIGAMSGPKLVTYAHRMEVNSEIAAAKAYEPGKTEVLSALMTALRERDETPLDHRVLILPAVIGFFICIPFGFAAVFNMRSNGLFAYYFKKSLDLTDKAEKVVYIAKTNEERKAEEQAKKDSGVTAVWMMGVLTIVACVGIGIFTDKTILWGGVGLATLIVVWVPLAGLWRIFEKANEPGWATLVPIYNGMVFCRIGGKPEWWILLMMVPAVGLIVSVLVWLGVAKRFEKGVGFAIGLIVLPILFVPVLGLGNSRCVIEQPTVNADTADSDDTADSE